MEQSTPRERQIEKRKTEVIRNFPALWLRMIKEWHQPGPEDRAWLMYSANYLLRTNNIHWAIDPLRLRQRLLQAPELDLAHDLDKLSFVLLTHSHADHLDFELIHELRHLPIPWVIPEDMLQSVVTNTSLSRHQVIVPTPLECLDLHGIRITPFPGLHWEKQSEADSVPVHGVPAMGYLIESGDKRWLFPGDTRTYDASELPPFGPVDVLFAHLWLGRGRALEDEPSLLNSFCQFCLDLQPHKIVLTHLEEFGRDATDYWRHAHAKQVRSGLQMIRPQISTVAALLGDCVML